MDWATCFQGKRILVAEDDSISRDLMADILGLMHCEAEFAVDGEEAVERFRKGYFDLILMDIRMPNKDGFAATREIRALEKEGKRTPIIALTASVPGQERENCVKAGADDYVAKPIHLDELRTKMAKLLLSSP